MPSCMPLLNFGIGCLSFGLIGLTGISAGEISLSFVDVLVAAGGVTLDEEVCVDGVVGVVVVVSFSSFFSSIFSSVCFLLSSERSESK